MATKIDRYRSQVNALNNAITKYSSYNNTNLGEHAIAYLPIITQWLTSAKGVSRALGKHLKAIDDIQNDSHYSPSNAKKLIAAHRKIIDQIVTDGIDPQNPNTSLFAPNTTIDDYLNISGSKVNSNIFEPFYKAQLRDNPELNEMQKMMDKEKLNYEKQLKQMQAKIDKLMKQNATAAATEKKPNIKRSFKASGPSDFDYYRTNDIESILKNAAPKDYEAIRSHAIDLAIKDLEENGTSWVDNFGKKKLTRDDKIRQFIDMRSPEEWEELVQEKIKDIPLNGYEWSKISPGKLKNGGLEYDTDGNPVFNNEGQTIRDMAKKESDKHHLLYNILAPSLAHGVAGTAKIIGAGERAEANANKVLHSGQDGSMLAAAGKYGRIGLANAVRQEGKASQLEAAGETLGKIALNIARAKAARQEDKMARYDYLGSGISGLTAQALNQALKRNAKNDLD